MLVVLSLPSFRPIFTHFYICSDGGQEGSDFWHAASSLSLLTESLYEVWVLEPERRRDAESMREAGLDSAAAAATTATTTTTAVVSLDFFMTESTNRSNLGDGGKGRHHCTCSRCVGWYNVTRVL